MKTLLDQVYNDKFLNDMLEEEETVKRVDPKSEGFANKTQELSVATGKPIDEVQAEILSGDNQTEVTAKVNATEFDPNVVIDKAYEEGTPADEVARLIEERREKGRDFTLSEYSLLQSSMLTDSDINPFTARTLTNMETMDRLIAEALEESSESSLTRKIFQFIDVNLLRDLTIGIFEGLTFRTDREGRDIREQFTSLKPEEFKEWAKGYVEDRKTEGFFGRDGGIWNLAKVQDDTKYLGNNPSAGLDFAIGGIDLLTLGATKAAGSAIKGIKNTNKLHGLSKARRPVDTVAVMDGPEAAGNVVSKMVDETGVITDEVTAGRSLPKELDPVPSPASRPANITVRNGTRKTVLTEQLEELNRRGSFGEYVSRSTIEEVASSIATRVAARTNGVLVSSRRVIDEGSDDYKVVVTMGKDGSGAPFRLKKDAEEVAANDPSLKVVKREEGRGWFVQAEERVNILGLPDAADTFDKGGFVSDAINKVFGAATVRLGDKIGGKFLQAEAGQALVGDLVKPYQKTIQKIKGKETANLSDFMTQLRDGELSYLRQAPDTTSFKSLYKTMYGQKPRKEVVEAYEALLDINDTTWQIKSSDRLKRVVAEGGESVDLGEGYETIGYRTRRQDLPQDDFVLDIATGRSLRKDEVLGSAVIFKVPDTFLDHLYVTNVKSSRAPERVDVMPYNVGGPRTNSEFRYFVGSAKTQQLASGKEISGGFKTLLGSFGQEQAKVAVNQLNSISKAVRELLEKYNVAGIDNLVLSKADYESLGEVIRRNNTWNKHITDIEDLQKLSAKYGLRFTEDFVGKARDQKVTIREAGENPVNVDVSFGEMVSSRLNMKRGDTPLMEFGGKQAVNESPLAAIADQFGSETFGYANRAASQNAVVGWVKLAERNEGLVRFPAGIPENDYLNRFLNAEVTKTGKYNDVAAQLREQQDVIKRRLNQPTWLSDKYETFTSAATEFIFEKTKIKYDLTKTDPASQLLKVGFYSKFGFFNPDQFLLQALHSVTIAAISPVQGSKALGLTAPIAAITSLKNPAARSLAIKRLAQGTGMEVEELNSLVKYIDESGRNLVDNEVIELQAPQKFGTASTLAGKAKQSVGNLMDLGTLFFKEGERISRTTGIITAFLEHRAKRPNINPMSPEGKLWITNREQDLTFRMTTQSRNFAQSGAMRVPTQWLSFSIRAMENIVVGRNFTAGERARMFLAMGPMFGLTGLGVGKMSGFVTEKMGYDPESPQAVKVFNNIKYGLMDELLSTLIGTETAYAQRVAPLGQVKDTFDDLFNQSLIETLFGPSGSIAKDFLSSANNGVKAMLSGRTETVREDLTQLVRNLSTADKIVKVQEIIESGNYRSRTRKLAVSGLTEKDAAAVVFGATPAPVQNFYDYNEMVFKKGDRYNSLRTRLKEKSTLAMSLLTSGDNNDIIRGTKLWEEINDEIWSSNLSNKLKLELQRGIVRVDQIPDIYRNALRLGLEHDAQLLQQQIR